MKTSTPFEVVVCGAGPAGIGAAVAAARGGARTLLIERLGFVGGMHTGAGVLNWCDTPGGPVFDEFVTRMTALGAAKWRYDPARQVAPGRVQCDTELSKTVALEMLVTAGVEVRFLCFSERAVVADGRAAGVIVSGKGGRLVVPATVVIDATADADIAASAGVACEVGDPDDGRLQHCNFRVWYENVDHQAYQAAGIDDAELLRLLRQAHAAGEITPPDNLFQPERETFPYNQRFGQLQLTSWELENIDPLDPVAVSRTLVQCQIAAMQVLQFCRRRLPGHQDMGMRKLPSALGVRESRRIIGRHRLTRDDVVAGRKFADGVARACFYMDLHDSPPGTTLPHSAEHVWARRPARDDWFEIPYGCLLPRDIGSLLVAGRCVSVDREALGAVRVMPTCMFLGSAAGCAAAAAVARGCPPEALDGAEVRRLVAALQ